MRVFVSSESKSDSDRRRRLAAVSEISRLGHTPVVFEGQAGRALRSGEDPLERCRALVRGSDVVVVIIDDTVSPAMSAEIEEAEKQLGRERISYYFVRGSARDGQAEKLWNRVNATHVLVEPNSDAELRDDIARFIGSYLEDAVAVSRAGPSVLLDEVRLVEAGHYVWIPFNLLENDRLVVTCGSNAPFYARLMDRPAFVRFRRSGAAIGMPFGSDGVAFTDEVVADRNDEWYVAIKYGAWNQGIAAVQVKAVRYRGES